MDGKQVAMGAALAWMVVALAASAGARAEATPAGEGLLDEQRWQELAYGLSLRPWAGARTVEPPPTGTLGQFVGEGFQLRVFVREAGQEQRARQRVAQQQRQQGQSRQRGQGRAGGQGAYPELDIEAVKEWAPRHVAFANPGARVLEEELTEIAGRPGARLVYRIDAPRTGDWILGQAFMQVDPYTLMRFELHAEVQHRDRALAVFDAVLASVRMTDPRELDQHRRQWINQGAAWLAELDPTQRTEHLTGEQWFRVLKDGQDVGYRRVIQEQATDLGLAGIRVEIAEHMAVDGGAFDRHSEYFESLDGRVEVWSTRTAQRAERRRDAGLPLDLEETPAAAAETALRTAGALEVSREDAERIEPEQQEWPELPEAYLSQVNAQLLPALVPRDAQRTFALYSYHSAGGRVALRIVTVVPLEDGGFRLHQRPAPEQRETVATYDAEGRLVQRRLGDGRVLVPTTAEQLDAIWAEP